MPKGVQCGLKLRIPAVITAVIPAVIPAVIGCAAMVGLSALWLAARAQTSNGAAIPAKLPLWAYPVEAPGGRHQPTAADNLPEHVPGSAAAYTPAQIRNLFAVPDWFPDSHPPMPAIVSQGRRPAVFACGYCHLPNGLGRPENESVAGLPKEYIEEQAAAFKSGERKSSEPKMASVAAMIAVAKGATPEEIAVAAEYFSSMRLTPWIRVVEADMVPKTRIAGGMLVVEEGAGKEPIGERVIEVPEDLKLTELRDSRSGFIAYVPSGSLRRGKDLVTTGGHNETVPCAICHGQDLRGMGNVPSIAGRSPSQMARQIIDIQTGARGGAAVALMKLPVAMLTPGDIVAITGYLASLNP